jgi:hypothetical protein
MDDETELQVDEGNTPGEESAPVNFDIATYPSDYTLAGIAKMWKDGDITIPEFQRKFVWSIQQSSLLIDSFLCGLPVPPVFFYIDEANKNLVIDGQQRILSVVYFFDGYFGGETAHGRRQVFRLKGLSPLAPHSEKRFEDLSESEQRKLRQAVLRAVNIRQLHPAGQSTSAFYIFERLNTGGTPLTAQEIRNVVFRGDLNRKLRDANKDRSWRDIIGRPEGDKHLKDVELVLRLFSLYRRWGEYAKPMKEFLNSSMRRHRDGDTAEVNDFLEVFPRATRLVAAALGKKPFHLRGPLNTSALDSVMCVTMENIKKLDPERLRNAYESLRKQPLFGELTQIGTTDTATVHKRFKIVRKYLVGA